MDKKDEKECIMDFKNVKCPECGKTTVYKIGVCLIAIPEVKDFKALFIFDKIKITTPFKSNKLTKFLKWIKRW